MKLIQDIITLTRYIPKTIFLALLFAIAYLFFKENGVQAKTKLKEFLNQRWVVAFILYLAFIVTTTLLARQNTKPYVRIFDSFGLRGDQQWDTEIIENILLFIPYTIFYIKAFMPLVPWKAVLILSALTSGSIEICQLLFWLGSFQLADLFHNVLGGMIGYVIWYLISCIIRKRE